MAQDRCRSGLLDVRGYWIRTTVNRSHYVGSGNQPRLLLVCFLFSATHTASIVVYKMWYPPQTHRQFFSPLSPVPQTPLARWLIFNPTYRPHIMSQNAGLQRAKPMKFHLPSGWMGRLRSKGSSLSQEGSIANFGGGNGRKVAVWRKQYVRAPLFLPSTDVTLCRSC